MPFRKLTVLLALKEPLDSNDEKDWDNAMKAVAKIKKKAEKINPGSASEENTTNAAWHICNHDIGLPCGEEVEIE